MANPVVVTVGDTPAKVYGAPLAPGFAALYQLTGQIPASLSAGDYPIVITTFGIRWPPNVLLTIAH